MKFSDEDMRLAVKRGACWLDEAYPNWIRDLDLNALQMRSCYQCVIGQAVGSYYEVIESDDWAEEHGFQAPEEHLSYRDVVEYYERLDSLWTEVVEERQ